MNNTRFILFSTSLLRWQEKTVIRSLLKKKTERKFLLTIAEQKRLITSGTTIGDDEKKNSKENETKKNRNKKIYAALAGLGGLAGIALASYESKTPPAERDKNEKYVDPKMLHVTFRNDLPIFELSDVRKHDSLDTQVWLTYGIGVYDVTSFIPIHPGRGNIMMGAGGAIDPFWEVYHLHKTDEIHNLLEKYRIGNLSENDAATEEDSGTPWENEPRRTAMLLKKTDRPYNAEPHLSILADSFFTPQDLFYVRNHLPVPLIDEKTYGLEVVIEDKKKNKKFKMSDLKKLPKHTVSAALICGGNRRSEMNSVKLTQGLTWGAGAIGNAQWSGVKLRDLLISMGVQNNETDHVIFEGLDIDPAYNPYAASIPLYKAMDERGDVLLAYEINGQPLNRDHGYPLRVIVPGVIGARNVKWLGRIVVSKNESDSHWQQNDYKGFSPSTTWKNVDFSKSPAIQNYPVTSAICSPVAESTAKIKDGEITVRGYAWSGGGNRIVRVDITGDRGENWHVAKLVQEETAAGRHYGWTLWEVKLPVDKNKKEVEIWSKAVDSNYNVQPESFKNTYNLRGNLSNAYHKVHIYLL